MPAVTDPRALAVFDSGIGGLTVLSHLVRQFPNENFIYLGDSARLPYGDKSEATILKYVGQNIRFLNRQNIKGVVIACNSASSVVMGQPQFEGLPLFNVIEPGAQLAVRTSEGHRIGVIGTQATVRQAAYVKALQALKPTAQIWQVACPLLVPLVEQGWLEDPITNMIVFRYLNSLNQDGIDTLILGCTHYPLLTSSIQRVVGLHVHLIHSGQAIGFELLKAFDDGSLLRRTPFATAASEKRTVQVLTTDSSPQLERMTRFILGDIPFTGPYAVDIE
jgi:glutamate racemase